MKNITISITISPEAKAMLKAQSSIFGGNQSAYITHLILKEELNLKHSPEVGVVNTDSPTITAGNSSNNKIKTKVKKEK